MVPRCTGQRSAQCRLGEQNRRARILQHEGQTVGRVGRIKRQIGAAGLEDANEPDQHLQRALDAQPNHHLRSNPEAAQMMRQLVGAGIERRIAQALLAEHHRDRLGTARRLGREQLR